MTKENLVTAKPGISLEEAKDILHAQPHREAAGRRRRRAACTASSRSRTSRRRTDYPHACKDERGRLRVGAARRRRRRSRGARRGAGRAPASTCWSSTPRTATRRTSSTPCATIKRRFPTSTSSPATSAPAEGARALVEGRRRRRQGRHGRRLDLHHAHRLRRRRAAAHRRRSARSRGVKGTGVPIIADGGIKLLRRHHQGDRRRRPQR